MDISVCTIDINSRTLNFAGAHHSLYIVDNGKCEIIPGDRLSAGGIFSNQGAKFTLHRIPIHTGIAIYMSTDDYTDQFGTEGNRYKPPRFTQFIQSIFHLNPSTQKEKMDNEFDEWKGNGKQIDDVLVWGIQFRSLT